MQLTNKCSFIQTSARIHHPAYHVHSSQQLARQPSPITNTRNGQSTLQALLSALPAWNRSTADSLTIVDVHSPTLPRHWCSHHERMWPSDTHWHHASGLLYLYTKKIYKFSFISFGGRLPLAQFKPIWLIWTLKLSLWAWKRHVSNVYSSWVTINGFIKYGGSRTFWLLVGQVWSEWPQVAHSHDLASLQQI